MVKFPFAAVAGQSQFKLALMLAAINPAVGGVLVSGPRGSAKSTLARGLADIMPSTAGQSHAFVTLPLGASEEMLVGTLDLQQVMHAQDVSFQAGLLAKADGGVLYVDEVNLLPDNLVDLLLDVATSGVNHVERDGISHQHKAEFILLGTMNPDEGELRPQLQDRFGLSVQLSNQYSIDERMDIVHLRQQFDQDADSFLAQYRTEQNQLTDAIQQAQALLPKVSCDVECRRLIAQRSHDAGVDGLRADIVWYHSALTHAALQQRQQVSEADVLAVEELVLAHRRQHDAPKQNPPPPPPSQKPFSRPTQQPKNQQGEWGAMAPEQQKTAEKIALDFSQAKTLNPKTLASSSKPLITAAKQKGLAPNGHFVSQRLSQKVNWFATVLSNGGQWPVQRLRFKPQKSGQPVLHLVLLDTSASTLQQQLFAKAKAVILDIADQAYLQREFLSIIGFGNDRIETLLQSRRAPKALRALLDDIPAGGGTPLVKALQEALQMQQAALRKTAGLQLKTYIITDGKTTQSIDALNLLGEVAVVDIEQSAVKRGKARDIAQALDASYYPLLV